MNKFKIKRKKKNNFFLGLILFIFISCASVPTVNVEYPVFEGKQGRNLQRVLGNIRVIAIQVKPLRTHSELEIKDKKKRTVAGERNYSKEKKERLNVSEDEKERTSKKYDSSKKQRAGVSVQVGRSRASAGYASSRKEKKRLDIKKDKQRNLSKEHDYSENENEKINLEENEERTRTVRKLELPPSLQNFRDQIPDVIFSEFSQEGYYRLIDMNKRSQSANEVSFSKLGLTQQQKKLKLLGADAFLEVGYGIADDKMIILNANITTNTTETLRESSEHTYNSSGQFIVSLRKASKKLVQSLSPRVKTIKIRVFSKYKEDIDVEDLLLEAQEEVTGDTPDYEAAFKLWKQANGKTRGKSYQVLTNLGTYYYAQGDFEKAMQYYEKANKLARRQNPSDRKYIGELRGKVKTLIDKE